jgi:hypothetical protein
MERERAYLLTPMRAHIRLCNICLVGLAFELFVVSV